MLHQNYERLSALDNTFLVLERANTPMHVGSTAVFDAAPLLGPGGGVDFERIASHVASRLHLIPRYRQRLAEIPLQQRAVWVDDKSFNLHYHLRHTSLPKPGDEHQFKRLCARIMSQALDRGKPLWETWIVEGLEGGRMAMISKVHHCMIDGISGADLLSIIMSLTADLPESANQISWTPRQVPSAAVLLRDEVVERLKAPVNVLSRLVRNPRAVFTDIRDGLSAISELIGSDTWFASATPFNQPIGPHRQFDWLSMDMSALQAVRRRLGGSFNDVVLAIVAGAVRRFLLGRKLSVSNLTFRVFVPVSTRTSAQQGALGNRIAGWIVDLPIGEPDARRRLAQLSEITAHLKESQATRGVEILTEVLEWTGSSVIGLAMRFASQASPFNLVVTNVPGPPAPLYLLGARMLEAYPLVPLFMGQALGVALFSNAGKLFWGFNADWDALPDLNNLVGAVAASFAELRKASGEVQAASSQKGARSRPRRAEIRRQVARQRSEARGTSVRKVMPTIAVLAGPGSARKSPKIRRHATAAVRTR
jgi:diacylglycerol O-acyltransferase / wax synthase